MKDSLSQVQVSYVSEDIFVNCGSLAGKIEYRCAVGCLPDRYVVEFTYNGEVNASGGDTNGMLRPFLRVLFEQIKYAQEFTDYPVFCVANGNDASGARRLSLYQRAGFVRLLDERVHALMLVLLPKGKAISSILRKVDTMEEINARLRELGAI
jgi:hypothetical protein